MQRSHALNPVPFAWLFVAGFGTLAHCGAHVRTVGAVAISGSGFSLGIGIAGLVAAVLTRKRV